jgi:hypothetical protein
LFVNLAQPKVTENLSKLSKANSELATINSRIQVLREFSTEDIVTENVFALALTDKNPSAAKVLKIRSDLAKYELILKSVESRLPVEFMETTQKADIIYQFETTNPTSLISFLKEASTTVPISTLDEIKLTKTDELYKVEVRSPIYWAPYPKELPKLTEPLTSLNEEEVELLSKILNYSAPTVEVVEANDQNTSRENPFD